VRPTGARPLHRRSPNLTRKVGRTPLRLACAAALARAALFAAWAAVAANLAWAGQAESTKPASPLPDAPPAQQSAQNPAQPRDTTAKLQPCPVKKDSPAPATATAPGTPATTPGNAPSADATTTDDQQPKCLYSTLATELPIIKDIPLAHWYARFLDGPQVKAMTPKEKAWLAMRNVGDPFNAATIAASSAVAIGVNSHSVYGPGLIGFGKLVGVNLTQDITGEFFGTFLIPSIAHQDPHYHRMPTASMKRRIAHCLYQVVWTQGDNGKGMVNYADLGGFAIDDAIGNLYIPGRETNVPSSARRYGATLATAPIDNFITEFVPDIARRIHVRVVIIQQIINQVARSGGTGPS